MWLWAELYVQKQARTSDTAGMYIRSWLNLTQCIDSGTLGVCFLELTTVVFVVLLGNESGFTRDAVSLAVLTTFESKPISAPFSFTWTFC